MARSRQLLSLIGSINPAAWDAIIPQYRTFVEHVHRAGGEVMLNPQPLPPKEQYLISSIELARDVANAAAVVQLSGGSPGDMLARIFDEWCGTPWPRPFPWPPGHPPVGPEPEPHPEWDIAAGRLAGALAVAGIAARTPQGDLQDALAKGAEMLLDASIG
ncbi:MAG: hypothetical protein QOG56_1985 [Solirubrobacteraceae bacterium]|jgi:hypothetical protein|nr:hypothetical protein [Solirubrobacteraceae bacterium]